MVNFFKNIFVLALISSPVWVLAQPEIVADGPLEFCHGDSVTLCVNQEYSSYLWNSGALGQCVTIFESGSYYPLMLDSFGDVDSTLASQPVSIIVHVVQPYLGMGQDTIFVNQTFETYQWYFLDTLINGATDSFIVAPGLSNLCCFNVEVTDNFGCLGRSDCIDFGSVCFTGIEERGDYTFSIHPNPANTYLTLSSERVGIERIKLFDITGKEIGTLPMLSETEKAITLDVSGLPAGIYFGRVLIGELERSFKWVKE